MNKSYQYDIALSFAGEDRAFVEKVANLLREKEIKVFYDGFEDVNLWGKNLYTHLSSIYKDKARYTVIFISKFYAQKLWTNHERENAQARAFSENREYILPVRFDDTEIPGILNSVGYINLRNYSAEKLSLLIYNKIYSQEDKGLESKMAITLDTAINRASDGFLTQMKKRKIFINLGLILLVITIILSFNHINEQGNNSKQKNQESDRSFNTDSNQKPSVDTSQQAKITDNTKGGEYAKINENTQTDGEINNEKENTNSPVNKKTNNDLQNLTYCGINEMCEYHYIKFYDFDGKKYMFIARDNPYQFNGTAALDGKSVKIFTKYGNSELILSNGNKYLTGTLFNEYGKEITLIYELSKRD